MTRPKSQDPQPATTPPPAAKPEDDLDDPGDPWRHPPVAPKDEGPLESFGRSISEVVTGPLADPPDKPKA
jgi:hypothetical protein